MGSNQGDQNGSSKKSRWLKNPSSFFILLISLLLTMAGGFVLGWWLHKYHPSNTQLWMVPFGFLLFLTPLIICLSVLIPDHCAATCIIDQEQPSKTLDHSLSQPIRWCSCLVLSSHIVFFMFAFILLPFKRSVPPCFCNIQNKFVYSSSKVYLIIVLLCSNICTKALFTYS